MHLKLSNSATFVGNLLTWFSVIWLVANFSSTDTAGISVEFARGFIGLAVGIAAFYWGVRPLQLEKSIYRPNLGQQSHKWLAVLELIFGGYLAASSLTGLLGMWLMHPALYGMVVGGVPLGLGALAYGIYLLQPSTTGK